MMRFQGQQTVRNMCVIAVLTTGAYFALFYVSPVMADGLYSTSRYDKDFAFHYRADENMPSQTEIENMASEEGVTITDYGETDILMLATDGYNRDWADDGSFINDYMELIGEESFISESAYNFMTGQNADVQQGRYFYPLSFSGGLVSCALFMGTAAIRRRPPCCVSR